VLTAISALLAVYVVASREAAINRARTTTAGTLIEAQRISTSLSDADRAVAGTFLTTDGAAQSALYARYRKDLAQATTDLADVAHHASGGAGANESVQTLTSEIPAYAGVVETARANDRQGFPVGAAYLGEANHLMQASILPAADRLYALQRERLAQAFDDATSWPLVALTVVLFVALITGLVVLQVQMSRRFRRTLNLALLGATGLTVVALVWFGVATLAQRADMTRAKRDGSDPLAVLTEAGIRSQQVRADDELTLVTRDSVPSYQQDYGRAAGQLRSLVDRNKRRGGAYSTLRTADPLVAGLAALHTRVRRADTSNTQDGLSQAIDLDAGAGAAKVPAVADRLDGVLASGTTATGNRFLAVASDAEDDLTGLVLGLLALGAITIVLILFGAQRRIEEYR
jgi:hypothetical protein